MRYLARYIVFFILMCNLNSCSNDKPEGKEIYYQFTEAEEELIIKYDYTVDQTIIYENQSGEKLHFKVISNEREKQPYYSLGTFSGGSTFSHYYENKIIRLEILENTTALAGDQSIVNYVFSKNFGKFNIGMNFPLWNIIKFTYIDEMQNPVNIYLRDYNDEPRIQMNINGHLFENIAIINSNSNEVPNSSFFGSLPQNVNKIYYDYDFGIVQFDEINGEQWKVNYPE